jgi:hypothetical protein
MNAIKLATTFLFLLMFVLSGFSQRNCGTMDYLEQQIQQDPQRLIQLKQIEQHTKEILQHATRTVDGVISIPVVVHVVYNVNNPSENISDAQIINQINILNEDFRRLNADAVNTPAMFQSVAADSEIEFCLADVDPNGNPTDGITRTPTTVTAFSTNNNVKFDATGGHDAWPAADYMNFWICDLFGGLLGYAQFPGGPASTDGIVCDYQYVGSIGTATFPFDLGRTATHEVGHWLNLRHIWGDGGCGVDDFVSDTPLAGGANTNGFPCTFPGANSCNTGSNDQPDMFQNYMDYSDDGCMNLFTFGQRNRMRALFEPGGFRESILSSSACNISTPTCTDGIQNGNETGVDCGGPDCPACPTCFDGIQNGTETGVDCGGLICPPCATCTDGIQNGNETGVDCGGSDCPACPTCFDGIQNGDEEGVDCGGSDCLPCASVCTENPVSLIINFDFLPSEVSWDISDGAGNIVANGGPYDQSYANDQTTESICLPDGCYNLTMYDSGGNGLCCRFGFGSYQLIADDTGATLASGGVYGASETTNFCLGTVVPTCNDGIQNGSETGVDCGGPDCPPCAPLPTCNDGIQNGSETGVDCGGPDCPPCAPLPTCNDGIQNGSETGVDCGGPDCPPCAPLPTCNDGIQNGSETGVDCGGPDCPPCAPLPTCNDGIQNGSETGVDCGGPDCPACQGGGCTFELFLTIYFDNLPEETSWEITNDAGQVLYTGGPYTDESPNSNINVSDLCVDAGCYTFTIFDSGGNGICCQNGFGKYRLISSSGMTLASGGIFGTSDSTPFCLGAARNSTDNEIVDQLTWEVYPIPTSGELNIRYQSTSTEVTNTIITNLTGQVYAQNEWFVEEGINQTTVNTSAMPAGVYLIHMIQGERRSTKRFIVVK